MEEEIQEKQQYNFTVINGASVRVGHCLSCDTCRIPICVGTDCHIYVPKHPESEK